MNNNDLYLEIADFSNEDGYIRYRVYNSSKHRNDINKYDVIPFTTYYLEALRLNLNFIWYINVDFNLFFVQFDLLIKFCEYSFFYCNAENHDVLNSIIVRNSNRLRELFVGSHGNSFVIDGSTIDDFKMNVESNHMEFYENWLEESEKIWENRVLNGNCVAMAMPILNILDSENCFLALSGLYNDYAGTLKPTWGIDPIIQSAYDEINKLLNRIYGFKFKECHFIDDVMRYTHFERRNPKNPKRLNRLTVTGRVLKRPISFTKDYALNGKRGNFNAYYSCCERKIIAHMKFVNMDYPKLCLNQNVVNLLSAYEFRIKYEPCRMCRPALIGCYNIGWDYDDFDFYFRLSTQRKTIKLSSGSDPKEPLIVG